MPTILIFHGAAKRDPNYAALLIENIDQQLAHAKTGILPHIIPVYYGDLLQPLETALTDKLVKNPQWKNAHLKSFRPFINEFISDILQWYIPSIRAQIQHRIFNILDTIQLPVHLVMHSWGCVIGFDLGLAISPMVKSVTTMGCALQYTHLMNDQSKLLQSIVPWTNFYHSDDIVGIPLNTIYGCTDIEIKDAGPLTEIVGGEEILLSIAAHNSYWSSKTIAKHIFQQIISNS